MGLPKPLGPLAVAFADFELLRRSEAPLIEHEAATPVPPMRIFYPTSQQPKWWRDAADRRWLMSITYAFGYLQTFILPSTTARRIMLWVLAGLEERPATQQDQLRYDKRAKKALHMIKMNVTNELLKEVGIIYIFMWPGSALAASVSSPIVQLSEGSDQRLPIVIFSHGLWACRTTYTALCCDLASHGYTPEHLDGSSNAVHYHDENGKRKWIHHAFSNVPFVNVPMEDRSNQLRQRIAEIQRVIDVLEDLDGGLITQNKNVITGKLSLDVSTLKGRLSLSNLTVAGHSFGGATAITACGRDARLRWCIGLDVWWEPVEKVDYERVAGKVPVLLLNTESFEWKKLTDARKLFLDCRRAAANTTEDPLVTEVATIKGTCHQDQSDIPLLFPILSKKIGISGTLDCMIAKNTNNWACLDFLQRNLMLTKGFKLSTTVEEPSFAQKNLIYSESEI
ncbi:hypothetical protein O6H91_18G035600 [Diphasiastrum complanatum]|uniref:Uncharacterized protein n=1 Tax=Diphasiastrum complanatum TaxID=34168 RepID=A0ACC2B146_DIPCM|nr:hypothetical protein O6H91_18G035600 [Diphasiastrum complanatum]